MNNRYLYSAVLLVLLAACSGEQEVAPPAAPATSAEATASQQQAPVVAPLGPRPTAEELERQRFDERWRQLSSFQYDRAKEIAPQVPVVNLQIINDPKFQETLAGAQFDQLDSQPVRLPIHGDVSGPSVLRAQVLLDRARFSVGPIDGRWGKNSEIAVYWFQQQNGLEATGDVDETTLRVLAHLGASFGPTLVSYTITPDDAKGPFTRIPDDVYEQEDLECLCYENLGELVAEKFHVTRDLLEALNPNVDLDQLAAGATLLVPNVRRADDEASLPKFAKLVISVEGSYLHGVAVDGKVLFHAPTTLGSEYDPSPTETLEIVQTTFNPWFHYQPTLFHEVPDENPEANLQPGPNSPVGIVWMALSKKHYGIHGTSDPDSIGYASSHGCVRLTNWDAHEVAHRAPKKISVVFVDTRAKA